MNFKSYIHKTPKILMQLALGLFIITTIFSNSIQINATDYHDQINQAVESISAEYNGTSSSTHGGTSAITNGVSYTRTGYLCYLLTKDGSPTGDPAYAFYSPGYNGIAGSKWVCTSRRGHSVSSWTGDAKWGVTPWQNGGSPSNEPKIKEWFLDASLGVTNAQQFVKDIWGEAALKNFESDEYILVIETIMNFQYSISDGNSSGGISESTKKSVMKSAVIQATKIVKDSGATEEISSTIIYSIADSIYNQVLNKLRETGFTDGGSRTFTSDPLIGTVPNLIQYKGQSTVFNSYTNKVAPHAEKIKVSEAGFTAYTGSGSNQLSDSEVQSYGVAMLIIHCKNDAIHTYWEPNGSPGDPEPRLPGKTGTCNIVKGYYKENLTTGAKESLGVYYEKEVTPNIIVSGEPEFELVEWRVTPTTSTGVDPINWNPPGSPTQQGKAGATLKLVDPEECVYVLLKQVELEEEEELDYNYLIPQSSITRRIWFSKPDNEAGMEKIQDFEFTWVIDAHDPFECPGHDHSIPGSHEEDCEEDCDEDHSTTCTDSCILIVQNVLLKN